jgi:hypothetical protein
MPLSPDGALVVAVSASAQYIIACQCYGSIYTNANYGNGDWTLESEAPMNGSWNAVAMSSTGQYVVASDFQDYESGSIYVNQVSQLAATPVKLPYKPYHDQILSPRI